MRETVLAQLVWRDALTADDFGGTLDDTVTIRIPAYLNARTRTLRAGIPITIDEAAETSVDVKLDTDVYKGVAVTDENMALDIVDFMTQIGNPILRSIVEGIDDEIADEIAGADYALTQNFSKTKPLSSVLTCRRQLNDARVPIRGRTLGVGSEMEQYILEDMARRNIPGPGPSQDALTDATLTTNYGGFRVVQVPSFAPDEGYAFHSTAFPLVSRAPGIPDGVAWGEMRSEGGFAIRFIKDYDPLYVRDRCIGSSWIGTGVVKDNGDLNDDGQFVPYETEEEIGSGTPILVRAVKLSIPGGS
jgi:hypothetical protein